MSCTKDLEVWIPVQTKSTRVPYKNFREFDNGICLFRLLVIKLKTLLPGARLLVSSDELSICKESLKRNELEFVHFIERPHDLLGNSISQAHLLKHFSDQGDSERTVAMVAQATDPFFISYGQVCDLFNQYPSGQCIGITASHPIKKHIYIDGKCVIGGEADKHVVTQKINGADIVRWGCFLSAKTSFLKAGYQVTKNNVFFRSDDLFLDVDNEYDFQFLSEYWPIFKSKNIWLKT